MNDPLRPRDLALLLLASGDVAPRRRARDQQADRAGLGLKGRVLSAVAAADPEPDELEAALVEAVAALGPPAGPARAVAVAFLEEWRAAAVTPGWVAHLLDEAVRPRRPEGGRRGTGLPG